MSHSNPVYSPPGTPLEEQTVGEIVAKLPSQSRVFQSFGIDFCCQGNKTVREACEHKGIQASAVVEQLEAVINGAPPPEWNPAELPLDQMVEHIIHTHHGYLRNELPRISMLAAKVARVHGGHTPSLILVSKVFEELKADTEEHISEEEGDLFPAIVSLVNGGDKTEIGDKVAAMIREHEDAGSELEELRKLCHDYVAPPEACNSYRALFAGLAELEEDMHTHIHLENSVLFPSALKLAHQE